MSAWAKLRNQAAVAVATYYGGAAGGAAVAKYQGARQSAGEAKNVMSVPDTYLPVSAEAKAGFIVGAGARVAGPLGRALSTSSVARAAMTYARKFPAWATAIGLTGVMELVRQGTLPVPKRPRRKGISGSDLQKFRRVAGFLYKWGPMCASNPKPRKAPARRC